MEIVYKFCGKYGLEVLRNLELKVTPPNQFNDPFEFTPKMFCSDPVGYATQTLGHEQDLKVFYEMRRRENKFSGSFRAFQEVAKGEMAKWVAILAEAPQHTSPLIEKEFLDQVSNQYAVLCMSGRRNSILMWGHYCDKPQGVVIGFDSSSAPFQLGKGLRPVVYVQERVPRDACWRAGSAEMLNFEEQIIFFKSAEWQYEAELRLFLALSSSSLTRKPLKGENEILGYFLPFPPVAIVSVTFGPRTSPEFENEVREVLHEPCFAHVKLDRTVLHKSTFELDFESL